MAEDKKSNRKWHRKEGVQSKKWCPSHKFFNVLFSVTQSFLLGFSWSSGNIIVSKEEEHIQERAYQCIWKNYIIFARKNVIPLLCQCGVFIHTYVSKNSVVSKDVIFYLLWYNTIRWSSHICRNLLFSHSIVSQWSLVNNTGEVREWNWQSVTNEVNNVIMKTTYFLNGPMFNLSYYFIMRLSDFWLEILLQVKMENWKISAF